jgi:DNA-binding HxlR family transcriptional regulator
LRFGELEKELSINPRTLSSRLKLLEHKGVLVRVVGDKDQQSVEYKLTEKGRDILPILAEIIKYVEKHGMD